MSAIRQRWIITKGGLSLPGRRHSMVGVVELNGPNRSCAAGSLSAALRFRPTVTVSRRSPSLITTTRPAGPPQTRVPLPSSAVPASTTRQSFSAADVVMLIF
jgi:hypothetical protein